MTNNPPRNYPRFWQSYLILVSSTAIIGIAYDLLFSRATANILWLPGTVLGAVGLVPLYGYVKQKAINPKWLWKVLLAFHTVFVTAITAILLFVSLSESTFRPMVAIALIILALGPYFFALYQYSFKNPHLW